MSEQSDPQATPPTEDAPNTPQDTTGEPAQTSTPSENINEIPGNDPSLTQAQNMDDQERHKAGLEPIDRDNPEEPLPQETPEDRAKTSDDNPAGSTGR
jgi:hypothetical protein